MICGGCGREYRGVSSRSGTPRCPYCDRPYGQAATGATRVAPVITADQRVVFLPNPLRDRPFYLKRIYDTSSNDSTMGPIDQQTTAQIRARIIGQKG